MFLRSCQHIEDYCRSSSWMANGALSIFTDFARVFDTLDQSAIISAQEFLIHYRTVLVVESNMRSVNTKISLFNASFFYTVAIHETHQQGNYIVYQQIPTRFLAQYDFQRVPLEEHGTQLLTRVDGVRENGSALKKLHVDITWTSLDWNPQGSWRRYQTHGGEMSLPKFWKLWRWIGQIGIMGWYMIICSWFRLQR